MTHINGFIDKVKFFEASNSKDFIIPLREAKDIHADITKLLIALHEYQAVALKVLMDEKKDKDGSWG